MGGSIGREPYRDAEEQQFRDVLLRKEGVVEGWVGWEAIDLVGGDVDFEFDVARS